MSRLELGVAQPVELGGRSRPQMIAVLLTKLGPELEKRYGWGRSYAPIFDESGRPIGFRPCDEQRSRAPVPVRVGTSLASLSRQQAAREAAFHRQDTEDQARRLARLRKRYPMPKWASR